MEISTYAVFLYRIGTVGLVFMADVWFYDDWNVWGMLLMPTGVFSFYIIVACISCYVHFDGWRDIFDEDS